MYKAQSSSRHRHSNWWMKRENASLHIWESWCEWSFAHRLLKGLCHPVMWLWQGQHTAQLQKLWERDQLDLLQDSADTTKNPSSWWGWWGVNPLENSFVKIIWESWWTPCWTCIWNMAKNSNSLQAKCYQQWREAFLPLYSALVRQFWTGGSSQDLLRAKDTRPYWSELSEVPQWWLKGWSHPIMKKDWESWDCSALKRLRGNLTSIYKYLMRGNKEDGARVFSVVFSDTTRGNRQNWNAVNSTSTQENTFFCHEGK